MLGKPQRRANSCPASPRDHILPQLVPCTSVLASYLGWAFLQACGCHCPFFRFVLPLRQTIHSDTAGPTVFAGSSVAVVANDWCWLVTSGFHSGPLLRPVSCTAFVCQLVLFSGRLRHGGAVAGRPTGIILGHAPTIDRDRSGTSSWSPLGGLFVSVSACQGPRRLRQPHFSCSALSPGFPLWVHNGLWSFTLRFYLFISPLPHAFPSLSLTPLYIFIFTSLRISH